MTETFLFVRLGEGEVYRNVVWKLEKCYDRVGGGAICAICIAPYVTNESEAHAHHYYLAASVV